MKKTPPTVSLPILEKIDTKLTPRQARQVFTSRIAKTAELLCEMLNTLKSNGYDEVALERAQQCFDFGITVTLWALEKKHKSPKTTNLRKVKNND